MSEIWQTAVRLESDSGRAPRRPRHPERPLVGRRRVREPLRDRRQRPHVRGHRARPRPRPRGGALPHAARPAGGDPRATHEYAREAVTGRRDLRKTFTLNALVPVDNAAWLLHADENGIADFDAMVPAEFRPALASRHRLVAAIPLMAYAVPVAEIRAAAEQGFFFMKIKIGQPGTQEEMLGEGQGAPLRDPRRPRLGRDAPHAGRAAALLLRRQRALRERRRRCCGLLDHARKIGAFDRIAVVEEPFPEELEVEVGDLGVRVAADESAHTDADAARRIDLGYGAIALKPIAKTLSMTPAHRAARPREGRALLLRRPHGQPDPRRLEQGLRRPPRAAAGAVARPRGDERPPELPQLGGDAAPPPLLRGAVDAAGEGRLPPRRRLLRPQRRDLRALAALRGDVPPAREGDRDEPTDRPPVSRRALPEAGRRGGRALGSPRGRPRPRSDADDLARRLRTPPPRPLLRGTSSRGPSPSPRSSCCASGRFFLVRARSADGAVGLAEGHGAVLRERPAHPRPARGALLRRARTPASSSALLDGVYLHESNYKWQGLPFWSCVASVELAILDLLGQVSGRSLGDLFGGVRRREIAVYRASGHRGNSPEEEIDYLRRVVEEDGAKAIKFRLGGRMRYDEATTRRDHALIRMTRKAFGDARDPLRRRQRLLRRADGPRDRPGDAGPGLPLLRGAGARSTTTRRRGRWPTRSRSRSRGARRRRASGSSGG